MKTNKYHKYHSFAAMQLCQRVWVWGSGGRASSTIRLLHPDLQNHLKPMKTMQRNINVPDVREGSAAERKPVNPPVTSGNQACLRRILPISINLCYRGGLPPPSPSGSCRHPVAGPPSTTNFATPEFFNFCSTSLLIFNIWLKKRCAKSTFWL